MASTKEIFSEINQAINSDNSSKRPTMSWIAGVFKKIREFNRMENALERSDELNDDVRENYINSLKLRDIALENGLMTREIKDNGFPKYQVTDKGSKFLQNLAKHIQSWNSINDLTFKQLRSKYQEGKYSVDQEWAASLPENEQEALKIYSQLTNKEFRFLIGLKMDKDRKQSYTSRIETLEEKDFESYSLLRDIGIITKNNTINNNVVSNLFSTLSKYDEAHLRSFNKSVSKSANDISAKKGLARNYLNKSLDNTSSRSSDIGIRAREFIENSNDCVKSWIVSLSSGRNAKCGQVDFEELRLQNIITSTQSKELTNFGNIVASIIKTDRDMSSFNDQDTVNSRMPMNSVRANDRQRQRSKIQQGRATEFNKHLHKVKESKNLSFKKYLIESN